MDRQKFEQRCAIKFCVKLGESATVTYEKLQRAYGEHSLSRAQVFRWHKSFLESREQVEDEPRVERVRSLVRSDRRLKLRMISSELNLNQFTDHQILTQDLDKRKVCNKMVPKNLMTEQKANRRGVCLDLLDCLEREPEFFSHVITGDEPWIFEYDPETKRQIREWHCKLSPSQESENEQIQNQIDAHFFRQSGDRPQGICATRTNCRSNFLSGSP